MFIIIYPIASIIIVGYFIYRTKLKHKKLILKLFISSALLQYVTYLLARQVGDYTFNYQNQMNACPSVQSPWDALLGIAGIASLILAIGALVFAIKDKKLLPIILLSVVIFVFGFVTFMMFAFSSFCFTF